MRVRAILVSAACVAAVLSPIGARAATCGASGPGGEWPTYGGTPANTRNQTQTQAISAANVANLSPAFVFDSTLAAPGAGGFTNTPVAANGCVFVASRNGYVFAIDAGNGELVWRSAQFSGTAGLGGLIVGSVAVGNGLVYVPVSSSGAPSLAALDETGEITGTPGGVVWSTVLDTRPGQFINASPVLVNGLVFQGLSAAEGRDDARGGYAIVDASTGDMVSHGYTISDNEYARGYRGASVWCSAAADADAGYVYACGGNPASKRIEHRYSNALLKIDVDPARATFGRIVDAYKGDVDQYYPGLDRQPVCDAFGETLEATWSIACLQLDLDFGSSPTLFRDSAGELLLGGMQKSGVFHAVYAENMQRAWTTVVGIPCVACNLSSPSADDTSIYLAASGAGQMMSLTNDAGRYRWVQPIGDGLHFTSTAFTNGVALTTDAAGFLHAFDAASGVPLVRRNMTLDANAVTADASSAGIAVAYNTIYVNAGDVTIAYR